MLVIDAEVGYCCDVSDYNYCTLKLGEEPIQEPVLVKLSDDGARFSRTSSFILLSFSFPQLSSDALSASG